MCLQVGGHSEDDWRERHFGNRRSFDARVQREVAAPRAQPQEEIAVVPVVAAPKTVVQQIVEPDTEDDSKPNSFVTP